MRCPIRRQWMRRCPSLKAKRSGYCWIVRRALSARLLFLRDPVFYPALQQVEGHSALAQHHIVERAQIEPIAQRFFCMCAERSYLQLADLVRQRLAGP